MALHVTYVVIQICITQWNSQMHPRPSNGTLHDRNGTGILDCSTFPLTERDAAVPPSEITLKVFHMQSSC